MEVETLQGQVHIDQLNPALKEEALDILKHINGLMTQAADLMGCCTEHPMPEADCAACEPLRNALLAVKRQEAQMALLFMRASFDVMTQGLTRGPKRPWYKRLLRLA